MGKSTRQKKIFIASGVFAGVLVLLATLPIWFPWVLKPVLKSYGGRYATYQRSGFGSFILSDVKFERENIAFQAQHVRAILPTAFVLKTFRNNTDNYLHVKNWTVDVSNSGKPKGTNSVHAIFKKSEKFLGQVSQWIPSMEFTDGIIRAEKHEIAILTAKFESGIFNAIILSSNHFPRTDVRARLESGKSKNISIETPDWFFKTELKILEDHQHLEIRGDAFWRSNRIELATRFAPHGLFPETAFIRATAFHFAAELLNFKGYSDLKGSLEVRWQTNRFAIDLATDVQPIEAEDSILSPVRAVIHATGDTNSIRLEKATVSAPWLEAKLSDNAEFSFTGEMLTPFATLDVATDLSQQNWVSAAGKLRGKAVLRRIENQFPDTTFDLSGEGIELDEIQIERIRTQGKINWPWAIIESASVQLKDGAIAEANLRVDVAARHIADGSLKLDGQFGHKFLPHEISYKNILLNGKFSGPLKKISHSAQVELRGLSLPNLMPLDVSANWEGVQMNVKTVHATISAKDSVLSLKGSIAAETNRFTGQFQKLDLAKTNRSILRLTKPFSFSAFSASKDHLNRWRGELGTIQWQGDETELSISGNIDWPHQGKISALAQNFDINLVRDFLIPPLPEISVKKVKASAKWTNGPATFDVTGIARFRSGNGTLFTADVEVDGNETGISIVRAIVGSQSESVLSGKGFLPITFSPANSSNYVQVLPKQRIDFQAATTPNPEFWEQMARWTGSDFRDPKIAITIGGTVDSPTGQVLVSANELVLRTNKSSQPLPRFQKLLADFDLVRDRIALNQFEVLVEGQPVRLTGELPLPDDLQTDWRQIFDWRKASANLRIVDAQVAPFARLFPEFVSPLGTFNLDMSATRGQLAGEFRLADAALRPISTLGSIQDIAARAKFTGQKVMLETFQGSIGGQPVELSGEINLAKQDLTGLPSFSLKLTGTNVSLARRPDLILRSDVALNISNSKGGQPLISGTLNLRDSFILSDLKLLIPGKVSKPQQRPPFFSVETSPFADWRLNVAVKGNEFLRIRSPIFRGEVSANFRVEGTLKEPAALGEAKINSGMVQFPFANLRVEQGFVTLTSENPYRPRLAISAASRTFGYDIKMDISGLADKPVIEFSSNPGLTSEQILLMVTAGELPRDEINFSSEQKAGRVAFFLGKNFISKFGGSSATEEKLEIRSGEEVSEQGQQTYYLEYKLSEDWSIIGEYDRFGGVNAGFKWKFYQK